MQKMTSVTAIQTYFGNVRPVEFSELRALSTKERMELATGAAKILGVELESIAK